MNETHSTNQAPQERRAFPRRDIQTRLSLTVEDESLDELIGIAEAVDISEGGLRIRHLPARSNVRLGHQLQLLLLGDESALPLRGEVVHHGTEDTFGIKFQKLSAAAQQSIDRLLQSL